MLCRWEPPISSLLRAIIYNKVEIVRILLGYTYVNYDLALISAAKYNRLPIMKLLIDNGASIHDQGDQSLRYAAEYGHPEIVKFLIANGADISALNDIRRTYRSIDNLLNEIKRNS